MEISIVLGHISFSTDHLGRSLQFLMGCMCAGEAFMLVLMEATFGVSNKKQIRNTIKTHTGKYITVCLMGAQTVSPK